MSDWADQCHAQGGSVIIPHLSNPNGEPAALIATGRVDGVEMLRHEPFNHTEYYRYLNCGYRLPLVGGTDKMSSDVPVGIYRTYVRLPVKRSTCCNHSGEASLQTLRNSRARRAFYRKAITSSISRRKTVSTFWDI